MYWGNVATNLTPPLLELPISRTTSTAAGRAAALLRRAAAARSPRADYDIFNQTAGASLHFLAAWWLVLPGLAYLVAGFVAGHPQAPLPRARELRAANLWQT